MTAATSSITSHTNTQSWKTEDFIAVCLLRESFLLQKPCKKAFLALHWLELYYTAISQPITGMETGIIQSPKAIT